MKAPAAIKPGMAERDLSGIAGQQHQRQRADRGEEHLAGEIEQKWRGDERKARERQRRKWQGATRCVGSAAARDPAHSRYGNSRWRAGWLNTVELLAGAEQAPRPHDQHGDQHQERHHVGQQRIDVIDQQHLGAGR